MNEKQLSFDFAFFLQLQKKQQQLNASIISSLLDQTLKQQ